MRMNHTGASSVIVIDAPTASSEIVVRHGADTSSATEQRPTAPKDRCANTQAPMAIFYDGNNHVVHVQALRQQYKWVAEGGYQAGFFVQAREAIVRGEVNGVALTLTPVRVIDLQCFSAKHEDYWLVGVAGENVASGVVQ